MTLNFWKRTYNQNGNLHTKLGLGNIYPKKKKNTVEQRVEDKMVGNRQ